MLFRVSAVQVWLFPAGFLNGSLVAIWSACRSDRYAQGSSQALPQAFLIQQVVENSITTSYCPWLQAEHLREILTSLGPAFVKIGQVRLAYLVRGAPCSISLDNTYSQQHVCILSAMSCWIICKGSSHPLAKKGRFTKVYFFATLKLVDITWPACATSAQAGQ